MDDFKKKLKEIRDSLREREKRDRENEEKGEEIPANETIDERELFNKEMEGVKRLNFEKIVLPKKTPKRHRLYNEDEEIINTLNMIVDGDIEFEINDTTEYIEGHIRDIDPNILRKLKRGEISVERHLDLHGKKRDEAKQLLKTFIEDARRQSIRCVLIIHGKGIHSKDYIPIIKEALKSWLVSKSVGRHILAFCSAQPKDGGTGAVYVLLRR